VTNNAKHTDNKTDFQNMFHSNHAIMLLIDPKNGKIVNANHAACQFYGYPYKKLVKDITIHDINILTKSKVKTELGKALNNKKTISNSNIRYLQVK